MGTFSDGLQPNREVEEFGGVSRRERVRARGDSDDFVAELASGTSLHKVLDTEDVAKQRLWNEVRSKRVLTAVGGDGGNLLFDHIANVDPDRRCSRRLVIQ